MSQADRVVEQAARTGNGATAQGGVGVAELSHAGVRDQFSEYLDGTLDSGDRGRIEGHLDGCGDCSARLRTLQKAVELIGELPPKVAPAGAKGEILRRVRLEE